MLTIEDLGLYDFFEYNGDLYIVLQKDPDICRARTYNLVTKETDIFAFGIEIDFVEDKNVTVKWRKVS